MKFIRDAPSKEKSRLSIEGINSWEDIGFSLLFFVKEVSVDQKHMIRQWLLESKPELRIEFA